MQGLENEIVTELTEELKDDPLFNPVVLASKVRNAIREVSLRRNYSASTYTDDQIETDLYNNYYSVIVNVARYDYNQIGAEGQTSHSENGVNRTWKDRDSLFGSVNAFVKIL